MVPGGEGLLAVSSSLNHVYFFGLFFGLFLHAGLFLMLTIHFFLFLGFLFWKKKVKEKYTFPSCLALYPVPPPLVPVSSHETVLWPPQWILMNYFNETLLLLLSFCLYIPLDLLQTNENPKDFWLQRVSTILRRLVRIVSLYKLGWKNSFNRLLKRTDLRLVTRVLTKKKTKKKNKRNTIRTWSIDHDFFP